MSHVFTSHFVLLLPFQWQSGSKKTTALPAAVMLQCTTRSGFWLLALPAEVLFSLFLLPVWLGLSIKRCTKAASLTDPLNNLPALSYVRLPTLLQRTCIKIKPFFRVSIWIIENKLLFFIYLLVLCWVKLPPAVCPKAQRMLQPPLSKTFSCLHAYIHEM